MGAYINPEEETKESFLKREGEKISIERAKAHTDFQKQFLVALVHNGAFTAAAIAFDEREQRDFMDPTDPRPIQYFLVDKEKLLPVSTLKDYLR